jgi:hypothetical protein
VREWERFKTSAARQAAAIEIAAAKFRRHIATVQNKKPTRSNKADLIAISRHSKKKGKRSAGSKRPAARSPAAGAPRSTLESSNPFDCATFSKSMMEKQGHLKRDELDLVVAKDWTTAPEAPTKWRLEATII